MIGQRRGSAISQFSSKVRDKLKILAPKAVNVLKGTETLTEVQRDKAIALLILAFASASDQELRNQIDGLD